MLMQVVFLLCLGLALDGIVSLLIAWSDTRLSRAQRRAMQASINDYMWLRDREAWERAEREAAAQQEAWDRLWAGIGWHLARLVHWLLQKRAALIPLILALLLYWSHWVPLGL